MKFVDLLAMSLKNLSRRKLRTALTVLGVVIGTASIVVMVSLGIGLSEMNRELISSYGSLTEINVENPYNGDSTKDPLYLTEDVVKQMKRLPYVTDVYPVLRVDVLLQQGKYSSNVTLNGMPYEYLKKIPLGQGALSDPSDKELKLIYGNAIIQWTARATIRTGTPASCRMWISWESPCLPSLIQIPTTSPRPAERTHPSRRKSTS